MTPTRKIGVYSLAVLPWLLAACAAGDASKRHDDVAPRVAAQEPASPSAPADRVALYGDLHLHTSYSLDAYILMGTTTTPDEAYRFGRGEEVSYLGQPVRRREPLDFMAITDHAENLGVYNELENPDSGVSRTALGSRLRAAFAAGMLGRPDGPESAPAVALIQEFLTEALKIKGDSPAPQTGGLAGLDVNAVTRPAWRRLVDAANRYYEPGRFTTLVAYEWGSSINGQNLHRNVIFRGDDAPYPFTSADSKDPEDLWAFLSRIRGQGFEALAIPHNSNASNGLMYDWTRLDGRPIDAAYARMRQQYEPLVEITQVKGTSETHPLLSPTDEFANFEIFDRLLMNETPSRPPGSYVRDGLARGLVLQQKVGANPFKNGFVGAGDLHSGLSASDERDYAGSMSRANLGGGRPSLEQARKMLRYSKNYISNGMITSSAGLTGVWAETNTRASIYSALRRRETFATSGSRIKVRFFGGWRLPGSIAGSRDWVARAYASAVPMGSDLATRPGGARAPDFVVWAQKDPNGANLDRAQVVKVWTDAAGQQHERIFNVAAQRGRSPDAQGHLAPIANTVDRATGKYANTVGSTEFLAVWRDPEFDPAVPAAYYLRVLEIPTPRWSTLLAVEKGLPLPAEAKVSIQERAWSSPIWYTP